MVSGHHAVLQKDGLAMKRPVFETRVTFSERYAMQFKDVPIIGDNMMDFQRIPSIDNYVRLGNK